jgi:catechol-2,3-dioxygenase
MMNQWEALMKRILTVAIALSATLLASAAYAQVTLNSVRIGAKDTVALAKFYQAAFGMQEVNRIDARPFRNTSTVIGIAIDPAGNRIELIQRP